LSYRTRLAPKSTVAQERWLPAALALTFITRRLTARADLGRWYAARPPFDSSSTLAPSLSVAFEECSRGCECRLPRRAAAARLLGRPLQPVVERISCRGRVWSEPVAWAQL